MQFKARCDAIIAILNKADVPLTANEITDALWERGELHDVEEPRRVTLYTCNRMVEHGELRRSRNNPFRDDVHGNAVVFDAVAPF